MQDTGIVRRIDDLGRIVIPKEMRKTLRIKEGDPLEIYANKEELIFKKYSPIASIDNFAKSVAEGIEQMIEKPCFILDGDKILCVSNNKYKDYIDKKISLDAEKAMKERKSLLLSNSDGGNVIPLFKGEEIEFVNQILVPIVENGDCYGAIVVADKEKSSRFSSAEVKLVQLGAVFLGKQFE